MLTFAPRKSIRAICVDSQQKSLGAVQHTAQPLPSPNPAGGYRCHVRAHGRMASAACVLLAAFGGAAEVEAQGKRKKTTLEP